eukprot:m.37478 g.37478  ORF g.37478 m.37478 type:complete len:293 (-) comp12507_c0_seq1:49-927(-)
MSLPSSSRAAKIFIEWLRGPALYPEVFPSFNRTAALCDDFPDGCLDPARVIIFSFIAQWVLIAVISAILDRIKVYKSLAWQDKVHWCACLVGTAHAIVTGLGSLRVVYGTDAFAATRVAFSPLQNVYTAWSIGYFAYDLIICGTMVFFKPGYVSNLMLTHHAMAIFAFSYSLLHPVHWTIAVVLATELSTPFVNSRTIIGTCAGKDSLLYKVNGMLIMISFFVMRVLHGGILLWYGLISDWNELKAAVPTIPVVTLYVVAFLITSLNLYWFAKIVRGVARVLAEGNAKHKTD